MSAHDPNGVVRRAEVGNGEVPLLRLLGAPDDAEHGVAQLRFVHEQPFELVGLITGADDDHRPREASDPSGPPQCSPIQRAAADHEQEGQELAEHDHADAQRIRAVLLRH